MGVDLPDDTKHDIFPRREKRKQTYFPSTKRINTDVKGRRCGLKMERVCCSANRFGKTDLGMLTANLGKFMVLIRRYIQNVRNVFGIYF